MAIFENSKMLNFEVICIKSKALVLQKLARMVKIAKNIEKLAEVPGVARDKK
jgi:hypothetical protein